MKQRKPVYCLYGMVGGGGRKKLLKNLVFIYFLKLFFSSFVDYESGKLVFLKSQFTIIQKQMYNRSYYYDFDD